LKRYRGFLKKIEIEVTRDVIQEMPNVKLEAYEKSILIDQNGKE